jgi:hypothetical protein
MRNILIITIILSLFSCGDNCDDIDCASIIEALRIIYTDEDGSNLLASGTLDVQDIYILSSSEDIGFEYLEEVIPGSQEKSHLDLRIEDLFYPCFEQECEVIFEFTDIARSDTLVMRIDRVPGNCCSPQKFTTFLYNGVSYLDRRENTIGAFVIVK